MAKRKRPVVLAVVSDVHTNSTLGVVPPQGVKFDDGGRYLPSKLQLKLWDQWVDYHDNVARLTREAKADIIYISNGDATDGDHHNSRQIITRNEEEQAYLLTEVFGVARRLKAKRYYIIRGTETHVGQSGATEEALAKWIGAEEDPATEKKSRWHLRLDVHGIIFDFQHHPGASGGKYPWTRASGMDRQAMYVWSEHTLAGERPPHVVIRSHKHVYQDSGDPVPGGPPVRAIITPAWQLKTAFANKVAPESIASIGGLVFVVQPEGTYQLHRFLYRHALPTIEKVA